MPNITRVEAAARAAVLTVEEYAIALDLTDPAGACFGSVTTIRFRCAEPGTDTFCDLAASRLSSATLNGEPVSAVDFRDGRLQLRGLRADNELVVDSVMSYSNDGEGLHRHVDPADGRTYLYAMSFLDAGPRWFACFDQPDLKAPVRIAVSCPPDWTVVGNGPATRTAPGRWELSSTGPLATYFTTLVAGPYHSVRSEHDGIALVLHARASLAEHLDRQADELFAITRDCLDEFHRLFGVRYPWGEYHQAFVPDFNAVAMENPGCVTVRDTMVFRSRASDAERAIRASFVAHEMAHMWFGDLVTMRWWDDLWLNESFAEYLGHRVCDAVTEHDAWVEFGIVRKAWGYEADRRPTTHPVAGNGAPDAATALSEFDGISYAKGAAVLRQLRRYLGEDTFVAGLRDYFTRFAYGNAELADLLACWRAAGAADLDAWAGAWLRTSGLDTLRVVGSSVVRERPPGSSARRPHSVVVAGYHPSGRRDSVLPVMIESDRTPIPTWFAGFVLPDDTDETWAKIAFDADAWPAVFDALATLSAPARVSVWNALRLAVADAEVAPSAALGLAARALADEPSDTVIASVFDWAVRTAGTYLAEDDRSDAFAALASTAARLVRVSPAESARQLVAVRGQIATTRDTTLLRAWLGGQHLPDGVRVDAELRWLVMRRLAALGELGADEIEAAARADDTSQGRVHAATCRALRPDRAAKQAAWQLMFHDPARSNYELYATARGFWHPLQEAQTVVFLESYFTEIARLAETRTGQVANDLAELSYPWTAVSPTTVALTEALLARDVLDPGVRKAVADAGDDLRRALTARRAFR